MFNKQSKQRPTFAQMRESRPPVPRLSFEGGITLDPISKRLRKLDNSNLSKPGCDEWVYLGTNETGLENTFTQLSTFPQIVESCHVGFSSWHNFDIAAQRRSSRVIICDINPENALFLHETLRILRNSRSPQDFIVQMIAYVDGNEFVTDGKGIILTENVERSIRFSPNISSDPLYREASGIQDELQIELRRSTSWVSDVQRFIHIRNLALKDKIALLTENICATQTFSTIAKLLTENGIQIDTVYTSNIGSNLPAAMKTAFLQTIKVLSVGSIVIYAFNGELVQKIYRPTINSSNEEEMRKHLLSPPMTLSERIAALKIKTQNSNVKISETKAAFYHESKEPAENPSDHSPNVKDSVHPQGLVPVEYPNDVLSETLPSQT